MNEQAVSGYEGFGGGVSGLTANVPPQTSPYVQSSIQLVGAIDSLEKRVEDLLAKIQPILRSAWPEIETTDDMECAEKAAVDPSEIVTTLRKAARRCDDIAHRVARLSERIDL